MVVLVGFGLDDDGVGDAGLGGEVEVGGEWLRRRLVGGLGMVGEGGGFEDVDVRFDDRGRRRGVRGGSGQGEEFSTRHDAIDCSVLLDGFGQQADGAEEAGGVEGQVAPGDGGVSSSGLDVGFGDSLGGGDQAVAD